MKVSVKTIVGIIGIVIAIVYCVHGVNFHDVFKTLANMNRFQTAVVFCLTTLNLVVRAMVFKSLISPLKKITINQSLAGYLVGVFSNLFLPFKLGDVAQGYFVGKRQDINKVSAVSAVFIQRVFEVTTLLILMAFVAFVFSFPLLFRERTIIIGVLILIGIFLLFLAFNKREVIVNFIQTFLTKHSPKLANSLSRLFISFVQGTSAMHNFHGVAWIGFLSMLSWIVQIIMVKYTAEALNISIDIVSSCVVLLIINIGLTIPIAPGNIGTFQFFGILALSLFSIPKPQALLFSIMFQIIQGIPVIIGGGIILLREIVKKKRVLI